MSEKRLFLLDEKSVIKSVKSLTMSFMAVIMAVICDVKAEVDYDYRGARSYSGLPEVVGRYLKSVEECKQIQLEEEKLPKVVSQSIMIKGLAFEEIRHGLSNPYVNRLYQTIKNTKDLHTLLASGFFYEDYIKELRRSFKCLAKQNQQLVNQFFGELSQLKVDKDFAQLVGTQHFIILVLMYVWIEENSCAVSNLNQQDLQTLLLLLKLRVTTSFISYDMLCNFFELIDSEVIQKERDVDVLFQLITYAHKLLINQEDEQLEVSQRKFNGMTALTQVLRVDSDRTPNMIFATRKAIETFIYDELIKFDRNEPDSEVYKNVCILHLLHRVFILSLFSLTMENATVIQGHYATMINFIGRLVTRYTVDPEEKKKQFFLFQDYQVALDKIPNDIDWRQLSSSEQAECIALLYNRSLYILNSMNSGVKITNIHDIFVQNVKLYIKRYNRSWPVDTRELCRLFLKKI